MGVVFFSGGARMTAPAVLPDGISGWLSYIESSGTQYIDTGFTPNQDTRIDLVFEPTSVADLAGNGTGSSPYGAAVSYNSQAFECYTYSSGFEFNYNTSYAFLGAISVGSRVTISHNKNNITMDVDGTEYTYSFTYGTFTAPYTMILFGTHRSSVILGSQRIYSCQIYDNGTLVRDFVPALNTDGVAGLYDKVNSVFYANAGTGSFVAGAAA